MMNNEDKHEQSSLPSVISKPKLLLPEDRTLLESIKRVLEPEDSFTFIGFWGKYNPLTPRKRGRPFTKRGGKNYDDGEKKEEY
jgi:hypothetical protein